MKFKQGDKVIVLSREHSKIPISSLGKTFTVDHVFSDGNHYVLYFTDKIAGVCYDFEAEHELIYNSPLYNALK
jgi:hypothetical protein